MISKSSTRVVDTSTGHDSTCPTVRQVVFDSG